MRTTNIILIGLFITNICLGNNPKDSVLNQIESAFSSLIKDDLPRTKYCNYSYQIGSADVDFLDHKVKACFTKISDNFLTKLLNYSKLFFPDSSKSIQALRRKINLSSEQLFPIEFNYKKEKGKVVEIFYVIYFPKSYLILSNGYGK